MGGKGEGHKSASPAALTCSSDISNDVKAVLVNGARQWKGDTGPAALLVKYGEHQAPQVGHGASVQLHKGPLLAVIGPAATGHLADDHALGCWGRARTAVLSQRGGRSNLSRAWHLRF